MNTEAQVERAAVEGTAADEFVTVPAMTLPTGQHVPAFQISKYLCAVDADGKATSRKADVPRNRITYAAARAAAELAGYKLLTLTQSQALALHIASVGKNWTGGEVGSGDLLQGIRLGNVRGPQNGEYVAPSAECREFVLPGNDDEDDEDDIERIVVDAAGNLYTWIFDDVHGDEEGIVNKPFGADSPAVSGAPFPSMERGVGWYPKAGVNWSGRALIRGGRWYSGSLAGVFDLSRDWPGDVSGGVGFRCTK